MTIAQALKQKKRLSAKLKTLTQRLQSSNTYNEDIEPAYKYHEVRKELDATVAELIDLKCKIYKANLPIMQKLYALSEMKSEIAILSRVKAYDATRSERRNEYNPEMLTIHNCYMTTTQRDQEVVNLQNTIDQTQDEIDQFNHTTQI